MASSHEVVTSGFSKYITHMMKENSADIYFAVGSGDPNWDSGGLPTPSINISSLYQENYRRKVNTSDIVYVDPDTHEESEEPTSTVRIKILITSEEYYGTIREYGLFAVNATEELNSGILIAYCDHERQTITVDSVYEKYVYINA